jgi:uncharacterized membrane protein
MVKALSEKVKRAIFVLCTIWLLLVITAPFTIPARSVTDLSGVVGDLDNYPTIEKMNPYAAAIYFAGDLNCHQRADRSFFLNENEMPFCSRDLGLFLGLSLGMLIALALAPRFNIFLTGVLALPIVIDGGLQLISSYSSNNMVRFVTGVLGGVAIALFLAHVVDRSLNVSTNLDEKKDK